MPGDGEQQEKPRILCIGAHPDDVELGMGGLACSLASSGHEILILDLTNGEPTPHGSPEIRAREAALAAEKIGARRITLDMPNRYLQDTIENRNTIAREIRAFRPDYMFAPYPEDAHPDHVAAGRLAEAARFYAKLTRAGIEGEPCFPRRLLYYFPVHIRLRMEPSFTADISDHFERKREAVLSYRSQFDVPGKEGVVDRFLSENRYWGYQSGCEAAEPFFQRELPVYKNWPEGYA